MRLGIITALTILCVTTACSSLNYHTRAAQEPPRICATDQEEFYLCEDERLDQLIVNTYKPDPTLYSTSGSFQPLGEYSEQIAYDLAIQFKALGIQSDTQAAVAVAPFISRVSNGLPSQSIANTLPLLMTRDLSLHGLVVNDETQFIQQAMLSGGDFYSLLQLNSNLSYLCLGTMLGQDNGIMMHVKLIRIDDKRVVAMTSKLLPRSLLLQQK